MRYRILSATAVLINELTFFYNAFLFFTFAKTGIYMSIGYWPWACGGAAILIWNRFFLRKSRSLVSIIAINTLLAALWVLLGFRYFFHMQGLVEFGFAVVFLAVTTARAVYLSNHEISEYHMVIYTEMCIIGTVLYFFIQNKPYLPDMSYNIPSLAALLLDISALSHMRLFSEDAGSTDISKLRGGIFLIAAFGMILAGVAGFLTFVSGSFRAFATQGILKVKEIIIMILKFLFWLLNFLLAWLRPKGGSKKAPMEFKIEMPKIDKREALNIDISAIFPWILILLAAVLLVYVFIKYRKLVFKRYIIPTTIAQKRIKSNSKLWSKLKSYMKALYREIYLSYLFIRMRHTPQGVFLVIERWGKRKGFPRKVSETPGAYLDRLMKSKAWDKDLKEAKVTQLVQCLIKELEWKFYSKGKDLDHASLISKAELKVLTPYFHTRLLSRQR